jgi:hypothetical protein
MTGSEQTPQPVAHATELTAREQALREDLGKEYFALASTVSDFDARLMVIKGWSVTLSLAALGLGFQQQHYALFGLGALTALGFWFLDLLVKTFSGAVLPEDARHRVHRFEAQFGHTPGNRTGLVPADRYVLVLQGRLTKRGLAGVMNRSEWTPR